MTGRFEGQVALITGGSSGIGKATAIRFAEDGARVVIAARGVEKGSHTVEEIRQAGGDAIFVQTDVSREDEVANLVEQTVNHYGRLDFGFNNAGIGIGEMLHECSEEDWDRVLNTNLKGVWLCMKHEIKQMLRQGGGSIVNTASVAGVTGFVRSPSYTASKHAVIGLTKSAALQYVRQGIRVNSICPGLIMTPMAKQVFASAPDAREWFESHQPSGEGGSPEEVAELVTWLCSPAASLVNGVAYSIDGGLMAGLF